MITTILWDVDGTLLDFLAAEKAAIRTLFAEFGFGECTDEAIARYSKINRRYWEKLENGELSLDDSIKEYEKAIKLIKESEKLLEAAEGKVMKVLEKNSEEIELEEFE